jgi:PAS domain S-box-containing protein
MSDERAFEHMADEAPFPMWRADRTGACIFLNKRWVEFTGRPMVECLGIGWTNMIHPDDVGGIHALFSNSLSVQKAYQAEYRVRRADGKYCWMIDSASPRYASDASFIGYVGSLVDIGDRKEAELGLRQTEQRLRIATRAAGIGIWEWDLANNTFICSPIALSIFGFPATDRITFEELQDVIHPEDIAAVREESARALNPSMRSVKPYEYRIIRPDGGMRWISAHGEAEFDGEGPDARAIGYVGTFQDITDRRRVEDSIRENEARLRIALKAAGLVLWELDLQADKVTPSPELNELFGYDTETPITAAMIRARYAPGEAERLERLGQEIALRGETSLSTEIHHLHPDGSDRFCLILAQAAAPTESSGPRAIGVLMDITAQKENEQRLATIARELQHRVKNVLAIVQSLAFQTFGKLEDRALIETFQGRLCALAAATDSLTQTDGTEASLLSVVRGAIAPYQSTHDERFVLTGPALMISSRTAVSLGMALHELCTNAVKYGALSAEAGKVLIDWGLRDEQLLIRWKEVGGPTVIPPSRSGFGTRLLTRGTFGAGYVDLVYAATGLECELTIRDYAK